MFWSIILAFTMYLPFFISFGGAVHIALYCISLKNQAKLSFRRVFPLVLFYVLLFVLVFLFVFLAWLHTRLD